MENQIISKYQITRKLGLGEMCTIYLGYEIENQDKKIVIKIFNKEQLNDKSLIEHFLKKIEIIKKLDHINVVPILDYVIDDEVFAVIDDLIEGQNLKFAVSMKDFTLDQNIDYFKQILSGVRYIHSVGLVHRSLDPSNIFFTDNYKTIKILDAGLSRIFEYDNPKKMKITSPMFLSPEQVLQNQTIGELSDVYTLGVILYFMLAKKTPFAKTGSYSDICNQIINESLPKLLRGDKYNTIIEKATKKNPAERFQSCDEFLNALG